MVLIFDPSCYQSLSLISCYALLLVVLRFGPVCNDNESLLAAPSRLLVAISRVLIADPIDLTLAVIGFLIFELCATTTTTEMYHNSIAVSGSECCTL